MTNTIIPSVPENKFLQSNRSDMYPLSNLWGSFNLDLQSNLGAMRVSPRMRSLTNTGSQANLGTPVAFRYFNNKVWAICGSRIFTNTGETDDPFTEDATSGFQTDYNPDESDLEIFNGVLCGTTTDALMSTDGSAWTSRDTISSGTAHVMTYFRKYDRLYYSNLVNQIKSVNSAWTVAAPSVDDYAILLSANSNKYSITCMESSSAWIWVGTTNLFSNGAVGKVVQWDGKSSQPTNEYTLGNSQGVLAIIINPVDDSPIAIGTDGVIYGWNGGGFSEIGRFPFADKLPYNINDVDAERFIHPNGLMFTHYGTLLINANNRRTISTEQVIENMPSGIWEWARGIGLTHKMSPSYVSITGTDPTDFGQNKVQRVGALESMQLSTTGAVNGTLMAGFDYYLDENSSTYAGIFVDDSFDAIRKAGYFTTSWIPASEVEDNWTKLWVLYRRLLSSNDKLVFKYRLEEEAPVIASITWIDTTHFKTATDISAYAPTATGFDGIYGGEVEILRGTGGGNLRHITAISALSGGFYTVTIDSAVTGVTTLTANARFQKWVKLLPEVSGQVLSYAGLPIGKNSQRIQLRGYMEFLGQNELRRLNLYSTDFLSAQD